MLMLVGAIVVRIRSASTLVLELHYLGYELDCFCRRVRVKAAFLAYPHGTWGAKTGEHQGSIVYTRSLYGLAHSPKRRLSPSKHLPHSNGAHNWGTNYLGVRVYRDYLVIFNPPTPPPCPFPFDPLPSYLSSRSRARPLPSKRTPAVHVKPELPRVPPPVSAIIAPDRATPPAVLKTPSRVMASAKLRAVDRKAAAAAAAAAATAAPASTPTPTPGTSQARWRENRLKAADAGNCSGGGGGGDNMSCGGRSLETDACSGSLLPFYFAPNEIIPGDGGQGDGGGGERGAFGCGGGSGGIGEAHYAARTMASRRSSLEEALYGSCLKRPSFNSWVSVVRDIVLVDLAISRSFRSKIFETVANVCACVFLS